MFVTAIVLLLLLAIPMAERKNAERKKKSAKNVASQIRSIMGHATRIADAGVTRDMPELFYYSGLSVDAYGENGLATLAANCRGEWVILSENPQFPAYSTLLSFIPDAFPAGMTKLHMPDPRDRLYIGFYNPPAGASTYVKMKAHPAKTPTSKWPLAEINNPSPYNAPRMTSIAPPPLLPPAESSTPPTSGFDPDEYRMTMGEHLDELRRRLLFALVGMAVAAGGCFFYGKNVFEIFCRPLMQELHRQNLNTQLFYAELGEPFMVYIKVSLLCAAALSAPWMLYQIWQFVAAGLYPHERKYITKYLPLSLALLIAGMVFVYFVVLPWTIRFFLAFGDNIPLPSQDYSHVATNIPTGGLPVAPLLDGDPAHATAGQFWFNRPEGRLKFYLQDGDVRVIQFGPSNLLSPHLSLPEYIDLVLTTLLTFGLCFQLPLVVLTLTRIGVVNVAQLRSARRYVYFGLSILAATMTPGDVVTAMLALMAPLVVLYELGIFLSAWGGTKVIEDILTD